VKGDDFVKGNDPLAKAANLAQMVIRDDLPFRFEHLVLLAARRAISYRNFGVDGREEPGGSDLQRVSGDGAVQRDAGVQQTGDGDHGADLCGFDCGSRKLLL
jgi:hypothetical protein